MRASAALLQALADGELATAGERVLVVKGDEGIDVLSGAKLEALPEARDDVVVNNRLRRELGTAVAALRLVSPQRETRLAAAKELAGGADEAMLPLVKKALAKERDAQIRRMLELTVATLELKTGSKDARIAAIRTLGESSNPATKTLLLAILEKRKDGSYASPTPSCAPPRRGASTR